jgi:Uma2 family endonuclease
MTALPRQHGLYFPSIEAFLSHEFEDDLPRELVDGIAVAHAALSPEHGRIVANLSRAIGNALNQAGSRCFVEAGSGVEPRRRRRRPTYRVPEVLIRCPTAESGDSQHPAIVIEVLSPSNMASEMGDKARDYKSIPSIRQIIHIAQDRFLCSFQRRAGDLWIVEDIEGRDAALSLDGLDIAIPLALVYENVPVRDEAAASAPEPSG